MGAAFALTAGALVGAGAGAPAAMAAPSLPCDIHAAGGTPCVAAYSTVRALYGSCNGPFYQGQRSSDGSYLNIGLMSAVPNGYPSDATENAVQSELSTVGYAQTSAPSGPITAGDDSAKCVDDNGLSTSNGTKIQMWTCNGGPNQQWHLP